MEKEYESEKKEPEIKKGSFLEKLLKHIRVDYWPDEEDEEIKVKRLWKCGTPMVYQQMREEEKKKNKYDSEVEEEIDSEKMSMKVGECATPMFLQGKYSAHRRILELMNEEEEEPEAKKQNKEPKAQKGSAWERFRKYCEIMYNLPKGK